jgi:hypothetical protein
MTFFFFQLKNACFRIIKQLFAALKQQRTCPTGATGCFGKIHNKTPEGLLIALEYGGRA